MFEFEVSARRFDASEIPEDVRRALKASRESLTAYSVLPWEEHCTECAMPACFATCGLYEPRKDGKCRRFHYGFGVVELGEGNVDHLAKVSFKRWGNLMAEGTTRQVRADRASRLESLWRKLGSAVAAVPDGSVSVLGRKGPSARILRRAKSWATRRVNGLGVEAAEPSSFIAEIYNPGDRTLPLTLLIRDRDPALAPRPYQRLLQVGPGFQRFRVPFSEIAPHLSKHSSFTLTFGPNLQEPEDEGAVLTLGSLRSLPTLIPTCRPSRPYPSRRPSILLLRCRLASST